MDMWPAYIESTLAFLPDAEEKIVFDKFHVMKYLTHAVDLERRAAGRNDPTLKKTGKSRNAVRRALRSAARPTGKWSRIQGGQARTILSAD